MGEAFQDREMTIFEHLAELRRRIIIAGLAVLVGMAIAAVFLTWPVIDLLTRPSDVHLQVLRPTETFSVYMKVALVTGAALAMPIIVWQALLFVLPALHQHERRFLLFAVPGVSLSFCLGLVFGFFVVIPAAVRFLAGFGSGYVQVTWSFEEYVSFVSTFLFWVGVVFETPLLMFSLAKLGVVDAEQLGRYWKYALLAAFVIGAIITPTPDPFNQTIVSVPIFLLYELGIILARFA
ncbi:MAG TPA: twin-arginine translocase subunit TatC [Chloroflexota bacterium]|nr:twin-arginine translocase subunit TatC [Chloroflexota bacterium]